MAHTVGSFPDVQLDTSDFSESEKILTHSNTTQNHSMTFMKKIVLPLAPGYDLIHVSPHISAADQG